MDTPQLITLIRGVSALEARGDGIGRPMDSITLEAVGAFRNAMLRRLVACHLTGSELTIDTESVLSLNDALINLEHEGDGSAVGLAREDMRLSAELRAALLDRIRFHPGGNAIARLMSRLAPPPILDTVKLSNNGMERLAQPNGLPEPPFINLPPLEPPARIAAPPPAVEQTAYAPPPAPAVRPPSTFGLAADDSLVYGAPDVEAVVESLPHPRGPVAA